MTDETAGVEKQAKSVALPAEDGGEQVIAQQNAGPEAESGSGEWPSPATAATGPAPGTTPDGAQAASRRDQASPQQPSPEGSASQDDLRQDASEGGDRGAARTAGTDSPPIRDALSAEPVASGSSSVPDDDDPVQTSPG